MEIISRKEAKEKGLKRYFTGKPCKHGHVSERLVSTGCIECAKKNNRDRYHSKLKGDSDFIEKRKARNKLYYSDSDNVRNQRNAVKKWREKNPQKYRSSQERWRTNNYGYVFIRSAINRLLDNWKGGRASAEELHGYTFGQLEQHIESQFKEGMSWENRSEWHIDHIKPIKAFLDEGITDPAIINALDNLQPLWAHENLSKGAKYDE